MQDSEKRAKLKKPNSQGQTGSNASALDPASNKLAKIAGTVGNSAVQSQFSQANASRDQMLQYLTHRLVTVNEIQQRELDACNYNSIRENWKEIADSQRDDVKMPDPTKWSECAALYERAARKLCNGELGSGSQLLKSAMNAEQRALAQVSSTIDIDDIEQKQDHGVLASSVDTNAASQPCDVPEAIDLADKIQSVSTTMKDVPDNPRIAIPWWTDVEEEESENDESDH